MCPLPKSTSNCRSCNYTSMLKVKPRYRIENDNKENLVNLLQQHKKVKLRIAKNMRDIPQKLLGQHCSIGAEQNSYSNTIHSNLDIDVQKTSTNATPDEDSNTGKSISCTSSNKPSKSGQHDQNDCSLEEYKFDILRHHRFLECQNEDKYCYMSFQPYLTPKMREILIDWLIDIHFHFGFRSETLHLTIAIVDRYLERRTVRRKYLQLIGVTALNIACKYEEIAVPTFDNFAFITNNSYTRHQIQKAEVAVLNALNFRVSFPTTNHFLQDFISHLEINTKTAAVAQYVAECCLYYYDLLQYSPSMIASCALYIAQTNCTQIGWTTEIAWITNYRINDIQKCMEQIRTCFLNTPESVYEAVTKKFEPEVGYLFLQQLKV